MQRHHPPPSYEAKLEVLNISERKWKWTWCANYTRVGTISNRINAEKTLQSSIECEELIVKT